MSRRVDAAVLIGLQILALGTPLLLGGVHPWALSILAPLALALLGTTVVQRWRTPAAPAAPVVWALVAFVALGLATTVPLPPAVLGWLAPVTARMYRATLAGWPAAPDVAAWRPLAWNAWATTQELLRFGIGFAAFTVVVAHPWAESTDGRPGGAVVVGRLFVTLLAGTLTFAGLGALQQLTGATAVLWLTEAPIGSRLAGPFVNPDHFAAWLEMLLPVTLAWAVTVLRRARRRLVRAVRVSRSAGVKRRRALASALLANQTRLWPPLVAGATAMLLLAAHLATDSRGGRAALGAGLAFAAIGVGPLTRLPRLQRAARRWAPAIALALLASGAAVYVRLATAANADGVVDDGVRQADVDVGSRLAVAGEGFGIVRDHLLLGTGLGSWIDVFPSYQAPPVEDGIWDHAHDDYLELAAETGLAGVTAAALFVLLVVRAARPAGRAGDPAPSRRERRRLVPGDLEAPDWRFALYDAHALRWGVAGGLLAIAVHSLVDFGLRMPGNLVLAMLLLGLLVVLRGERRAARSCSPALLFLLVAASAAWPLANRLRLARDELPLSPADALAAADARLSEDGDADGAEGLARRAVDLAPGDRDAHRALAQALGERPGAEDEFRRAIALDPWAAELRDELALWLWQRGRVADAAVEIEESLFRYPHLATHAFLDEESGMLPATTAHELLRQVTDGETMRGRLALLDAALADAIDRGLLRAFAEASGSALRGEIVQDRVVLLEARDRWHEAGETLRAQGDVVADNSSLMARAADDFLQAGDVDAAETALLIAIKRTPQDGTLYRRLAIDVYARRGDFDVAERVLDAGGRNASDMVPIYRGITEVLSRRDARREPLDAVAGGRASADGDAERVAVAGETGR